jgi:cytochrome c-type biogenesis protein CcmE
LLVFGVGAYHTISGALTPYVSFAYAEAANRSVQIKGLPVDGSLSPGADGTFTFRMDDMDGGSATVYHRGEIPPNLMDADNVVVVGRFDGNGNFVAQRILVKCPTRYVADEQPQR